MSTLLRQRNEARSERRAADAAGGVGQQLEPVIRQLREWAASARVEPTQPLPGEFETLADQLAEALGTPPAREAAPPTNTSALETAIRGYAAMFDERARDPQSGPLTALFNGIAMELRAIATTHSKEEPAVSQEVLREVREALAFYGGKVNWSPAMRAKKQGGVTAYAISTLVEDDGGERARKALAALGVEG